jgi:hypothetical protein
MFKLNKNYNPTLGSTGIGIGEGCKGFFTFFTISLFFGGDTARGGFSTNNHLTSLSQIFKYAFK